MKAFAEILREGIAPGFNKMMDSLVQFFQPIVDALPPGLTIEDLADYEEHNGGIDYRWHNKCDCIRCIATRQLMKDKMPFSQPNANGKSDVHS